MRIQLIITFQERERKYKGKCNKLVGENGELEGLS